MMTNTPLRFHTKTQVSALELQNGGVKIFENLLHKGIVNTGESISINVFRTPEIS